MQKVEELKSEPNLLPLVTPKGIKNEKVYNWYFFPHSFSPGIVDYVLDRYNLKDKPDLRLLDPFSGSGTAILRSIELGISAVGIDIMPFSVHLGRAKVGKYNKDELRETYRYVLSEADRVETNFETDLSFVSRIFDADSAAYISKLSKVIKSLNNNKDFFITLIAKVAEQSSGAVKSGGFTRNHRSQNKKSSRSESIKAPSELSAVLEIIDAIFNEMLDSVNSVDIKGEAKFYIGDARNIHELSHEKNFDIILTSPPYPNRQDYTRIFAAELFATFSTSNADHKSLRYMTLRSHLEAKAPNRPQEALPDDISTILEETIANILRTHQEYEDKKNKTNPLKKSRKIDSRVPRMIKGYFEDIYLFLRSSVEKLNVGGYVCIIVANVRHSGSVIECDRIIVEIGKVIGFEYLETLVAREKGNSSQQMKYLERAPLRESIVVLRKGGSD